MHPGTSVVFQGAETELWYIPAITSPPTVLDSQVPERPSGFVIVRALTRLT